MAVHVSGNFVTFTPPRDAVALIGDMTNWERFPRLEARGPITLEFPRNSWIEYAWVDASSKPFADPDNPQKSANPWYAYARAVEVGTYFVHPLLEPAPGVPEGKVERLAWDGGVFPGTRRAYVYTPPGYDPEGRDYPVFYVQDGVAFYRTGKLGELMDRMLHLGRIQPAVLVFLEPHDRLHEYYLNPKYGDFLTLEVLPRIEAAYLVRRDPAGRGLWGASLGGLISLYLALERPETYGVVVSHSGCFTAHPNELGRIKPNTVNAPEYLLERLLQQKPKNLRLSLDTGTLEWLTGPNRRMAAAAQDLGLYHQYREYSSGHNWVTWKNALPEALEWVLSKVG